MNGLERNNLLNSENIGIALSGGGIRATIFHLGVFEWLASKNLFEKISKVSSVSGASMCVGLIYAHNNLKWPTSKEYLNEVLPKIKETLFSIDLQTNAILKLIISPHYWNRKANLLAKLMESKWNISGTLQDLEDRPLWYVNCTTYETGKRFRFSKNSMGDYILGFSYKPDIALSEIIASSAGFPVLIGPYTLQMSKFEWKKSYYSEKDFDTQKFPKVHLWDGGVYDNLGAESIFKFGKESELSKNVDYMIISNASASINLSDRSKEMFVSKTKRILDIAADQINALRSRMIMDFITQTQKGLYLKIGNSADKITNDSKCSKELRKELIESSLSNKDCDFAENYPTTLKRPTKDEFELLLRHGFEVAKNTYSCYVKDDIIVKS